MKRHVDMHGPTARESRMIELHDAGLSPKEIGAEMGLSSNYVHVRLQALSPQDTKSDKDFFRNAVEGTLALGAALIAAGGHR